MRTLGLLLLVCAACAKKPAPKAPAAAPPASETDKKSTDDAGKPTNVQRTGDPCDGGEKPH
ncbi:MAG TPA: hypothetical protein VF469_27670 [Kofleriaceae bacterium]